jgi:hypothetical protein
MTPLAQRPDRAQHQHARPRPGEERLCTRGPDPVAPARLAPATHRRRARRGTRRRRTRRGIDVARSISAEDVIGYLHEQQVTLTYDSAAGALRAGTADGRPASPLTASQPRPQRPSETHQRNSRARGTRRAAEGSPPTRRQVTTCVRQAETPAGHSPCCQAFSTGPDNAQRGPNLPP